MLIYHDDDDAFFPRLLEDICTEKITYSELNFIVINLYY